MKTIKDFVSATQIVGSKSVSGTFEEVKEHIERAVAPEYYRVKLPSGEEMLGDEFLENYHKITPSE